jgi:hypothetical protein
VAANPRVRSEIRESEEKNNDSNYWRKMCRLKINNYIVLSWVHIYRDNA